ncbi:MAG: Kazal-type serine protease inhibitor [Myxococcota bacterium]|nr:Kazal-type serine protease inhibitor [Myxococcota bacterium]
MSRSLLAWWLLVLGYGCGGDEVTPPARDAGLDARVDGGGGADGSSVDGGASEDGSPRTDGGAVADGGATTEGGSGGDTDAGDARDAGGETDAGTHRDAAMEADAGGGRDAGAGVDAGGGRDAGAGVDAGGGRDAGAGADGGTGGPCRSNADCPARGWYCAGMGCTEPGRCAMRPEICIEIYRPVCGCDGRTYPNDCYAAAAGMRIAHAGPCEDRGDCGAAPRGCCGSDGDCARGERCVGEMCGGDVDVFGVCKEPPARGQCWEDADCPRGTRCIGASVCPCGAACLVPDAEGRCEPIGIAP